ncbi:hypothetical protein MACJ_003054 [Theileria orientalis]|uniref:Non-canonical E2 ubiquitin-conjugating enzyme C-terminal domain-containing protein n=1 Tax=Theileria orientalis TaxID=68886 RepID=A0A976M6Z8_THEOR|nr:hypothetical protein MACJ_003054 [Theileria orientalis]
MRGKNKLADILDYVELNHDKSNFEELDESHLSELGYLFRQLDEKSLHKVISSLSRKCDVSEVLKENAPEVYNRHVMDPEMVTDVATGIDLLNDQTTSDIGVMETDDPDQTNSMQEELDYMKIARFAPIRLTITERKLMRLLESTLHVSEYTDKVDIIHEGSKSRAIIREIKEVSAILSGLAIAYNYEAGQKLLKERDYYNNAEFFRNVFEIGRRYKILNPDKMRNSYGKLIYFLMDSRKPEIKELLNFDCVIPVNTVYSFLKSKKNGLQLLSDPKLQQATKLIVPDNKSRYEIENEIFKKEEAIKYLVGKYAYNKRSSSSLLNFSFLHKNFYSSQSNSKDVDEGEMSLEEVENCLYSLSDYNAHLSTYRTPIDKMIELLTDNFHPTHPINPNNPKVRTQRSEREVTSGSFTSFLAKYTYTDTVDLDGFINSKDEDLYNLSIDSGYEGSRLTHNHSRQFLYVLQSLQLWREIAHQMFVLWHKAELDLLDGSNPYRLRNTGQGLNRVQEAPQVLSEMRKILKKVQSRLGTWIGSHAIHMGDHNVPNSFLFIDKYTQIPRILSPVVNCIEKLPELYKSNKNMKLYIDNQFGSLERLKMTILVDFFRHAFDGSGADNFNDAGSCIDGRLTSAWNWCSKIEKKSYFNVFLLTGFNGFDGRFND